VGTFSHSQNAKMVSSCRSIRSVFSDNSAVENVTKAEVLFTNFLIKHNVALAAADHAGPLFKAMFPDSSIASKCGCARTKTSAILEVVADDEANAICKLLRKSTFSLGTDGSTDIGTAKLYPLVVRYFDPQLGRIVCALLALKELKAVSTGENIFNLVREELCARSM